jgi:hypothetical protein
VRRSRTVEIVPRFVGFEPGSLVLGHLKDWQENPRWERTFLNVSSDNVAMVDGRSG